MNIVFSRIDNIILTDQYDASLVILKHRFCWEYTDIFYVRSVVGNSSDVKLSASGTQKLLSAKVNLGDKLLYDTLNNSWWKQPELQQEHFWDEVNRIVYVKIK